MQQHLTKYIAVVLDNEHYYFVCHQTFIRIRTQKQVFPNTLTCPMKMFPAAHRDSGADVPRLTLMTQAILPMTTCMAPT